MEQFKRAILKNNQRQMVINRRSIEALKTGRHVMAGWRDETTAMIALWHEANRALAQANAILRGGPEQVTAPPKEAEISLELDDAQEATRTDDTRKRRRSRREHRTGERVERR